MGAPLLTQLGLDPFRPRAPWWGPDLQTLRDTLHPMALPPDRGEPVLINLSGPAASGDKSAAASGSSGGSAGAPQLLALLDPPLAATPAGAASSPPPPRGLVVLLHGLGGGSDGLGVRRLGLALQGQGFAVLRLNLRGAGRGRPLAPGTYAAACSPDLGPVLQRARELAGGRPLFGAGLSLGGTILLNACLDGGGPDGGESPPLDGLVCVSSPLDLERCAWQIERPRNGLYQRWLLGRLRLQTLADPFGITAAERQALLGLGLGRGLGRGPGGAIRTIRAFDAAITAPRWGYRSVEHYYAAASPLHRLLAGPGPDMLPPTLLVHAIDDPWVPAAPARQLAQAWGDRALPRVLLSPGGGHNGFHAPGDQPLASWADRVVVRWLEQLAPAAPLRPG